MILMALSLFMGACSKYDDGPYFSLYGKERRVQGKWYFSKVLYNDVDSTDVYRINPIQSVEFFTNPDKDAFWNAYTWSTRYGATSTVDYGFWKMNDEKDSLTMITTVTVYPGGEVKADTVEYKWKIDRLAYTEFWMHRQAGDTTNVTWRLWKLAY